MWCPFTASLQEAHDVSLSRCPSRKWFNIISETHSLLAPPPVVLEEGLLWCTDCGDPATVPQAAMTRRGLRVAQSM